jgi:aspartate ammonia-lyase
MRLLLISNGKREGQSYLEHARDSLAWYVEQVRPAFEALGLTVTGVHAAADPCSIVRTADVVAVGGGNTWKLLRALHDHGLDAAIREQVGFGARYVGWSAGANVACPTIQTTNDMPIADPLGMHAIGLVPFQINPHYLHGNPPGFMGETRETRITEYLEVCRDSTVVGLREGTMLRVADTAVELHGVAPARIFRWRETPEEVEPGDDLSFLLDARIEHDSLGDRVVPRHVYYGVQTLRAVENFPISGIRLRQFPDFVRAFALVKKAAAITNGELGGLEPAKRDAIVAACDEIAAGGLADQFVVDMVQGGAGTSTNMNVNEVVTNRALELLGRRRGDYVHLHPNDDTNRSQSTNDAYPTAIKLGTVLASQRTVAAMRELQSALQDKALEFADVLKMGRTELQDAVPMTLGQEFGAYAVMVGEAVRAIERAAAEMYAVGMGATAIGTGLNAPEGYAERIAQVLAELTGLPITKAGDLVEATQDSGEFVSMSAALKRAAVQISKIANDLRLLSSGPRTGFYEIRLPSMQPGSSIMPGKVNPVIPEMVNEVCYQLIGFDMTVTMAAEASQLELNHAEPIIALDLLQGLELLGNACRVFADRCIRGIEANREICRLYVERSIGIVTALNPVIGYERSAALAKEALATGGSVVDLAVEKGWLSKEELEDLLRPERMANPRAPR